MKKVVSIICAVTLIGLLVGCSNQPTIEMSSGAVPTTAQISATENPVLTETTAPSAETTVAPTTEATTVPVTESAKTIQLTDLTSIAESPKTTDRLTDNYGNTYGTAIINDTTCYEYLLDGQYSVLKGTLYIPKGETGNVEVVLTVKGDGYVLYASPLMAKTSRPQEFEVNIAGFNKLVIEWNRNSYYLRCCLANAVLSEEASSGQEAVDPKTLPREITGLTSIAEKPEKTDKLTDVLGNTYNYAIYNTIGGNECFEYLLDKKYSKFKGTLYFPRGETTNKSITMTLTADGQKIYESPAMTVSSAPVDFEVDVSQYNDFKINFSKNAWSGTLCIGNAYIYYA